MRGLIEHDRRGDYQREMEQSSRVYRGAAPSPHSLYSSSSPSSTFDCDLQQVVSVWLRFLPLTPDLLDTTSGTLDIRHLGIHPQSLDHYSA
jgi:hypothetical protein